MIAQETVDAYHSEIRGKIRIEEDREFNPLPTTEALNTVRPGSNTLRIWKRISAVSYLMIVALGCIIPIESFLEIIFRIHEILKWSTICFIVILDTVQFIYIRSTGSGYLRLIRHVATSLCLLVAIFAAGEIFETLIGPKLTTIGILNPLDMSTPPSGNIDVDIFARKVTMSIYLIVETPQGTQWVQLETRIPHNRFKATLHEHVRLGEGYIVEGERFKIFAIGTDDHLEIGLLPNIPPRSVVSNSVTVTLRN